MGVNKNKTFWKVQGATNITSRWLPAVLYTAEEEEEDGGGVVLCVCVCVCVDRNLLRDCSEPAFCFFNYSRKRVASFEIALDLFDDLS